MKIFGLTVSLSGMSLNKEKKVGGLLFFLWIPGVFTVLVFATLSFNQIKSTREAAVENEAILLRVSELLLKERINVVSSDLRIITESRFTTDLTSSPPSLSKKNLASLFLTLLAQKKEYEHIRYVDSSGQEVVGARSADGQPRIIQERALKTTVNYDYFEDILKMRKGEMYVSPKELHGDAVEGERKVKQVIRFGIVDFDHLGRKRGAVVIDCLSSAFVSTLQEIQASSAGLIMLLTDAGLPLVTETSQDAIGYSSSYNEMRKNSPFRSRYPEVWSRVKNEIHGTARVDDTLFVFSSVSPLGTALSTDFETGLHGEALAADANSWVLVSLIPADYLTGKRGAIVRWYLFLFLALLFSLVVLSIYFVKVGEGFTKEREYSRKERRRYLKGLEKKVAERTKALSKANRKLSAEIEERVFAEEGLENSNYLISQILENLDGIIYVSDFETHEILFANQYLKTLFGFDPTGKKCWQYIHSSNEGSCSICNNVELLDDHGKPSGNVYWEYQSPFDKKWYAAKDLAIQWSGGKYARLEIAIDITAHKHLEKFLKEARMQAERSSLTKNRFVALVAHDLKSPFYSILGMLKRILAKEELTHKVHKQFLENIINNGHRMLKMIDNLLSMDRLQTGELKPNYTFFDVSVMVDEVLENFSHLAQKKDVKLKSNVPSGIEMYADNYLYFVVLNNLVSNAVKYSYEEGEVSVEMPLSENSCVLAVRDTGRGIPKEVLQDILNPGIKTTSAGTSGEKGTGLGLLFCQEILAAHGGNMVVESSEDRGTTFFIELPELCRYQEK